MDGLPTTDEFFGPTQDAGPKELPTTDDFFAPQSFGEKTKDAIGAMVDPYVTTAKAIATYTEHAARVAGSMLGISDPPPSSPQIDDFFHKTPWGRILDHMGQGLEQGWGDGPMTFADDTQKWLKDVGIFQPFMEGQQTLVKAFNEAIVRPAVVGLSTAAEVAARAGTAAFVAAQAGVEATGQEAESVVSSLGNLVGVENAGPKIGVARLGRDIAAIPEAFMGSPHPFGMVPEEVIRARNLGVIGEGEAGWKGTAAVQDPKVAERRYVDAYKESDAARAEEPPAAEGPRPGEATPGSAPAEEATAAQPLPDVHTVARNIAPEVFEKYDALAIRRDTFGRWLGELRETRDTQATADLDKQIADTQSRLEDATGKRAATYRNRLEDLQSQRDAALEEARKAETPDIKRIREELQKTDYAMRDLAPDVSAAYRNAREIVPEPETPAPTEAPRPSEPALENGPTPVEQKAATENAEAQLRGQVEAAKKPAAETLGKSTPQTPTPTEATAPPAEAEPAEPSRPIPEQMATIADDVSKKLVAAGRPKAEADAASQIIAARYATRAARFNGAKGTAEEQYRAEGADILAGRERAHLKEPELAQGRSKKSMGGKVHFDEDGTATITLMKRADASTFIHESGHVFLEEMLRDANDEAAPEILRKDMQTVRDWLGAKDGADITTKQHEQFARGFERYLMEGRAPSQGLARVFEQFKDWLTNIYETVQKLKSPITDDIRQVFDRLLETEPHEAVIAEDRKTESMADRHEAMVDSTPPERASQVADEVRTEIETHARAADEVADEFGGRRVEGEPAQDAGAPDRGDAGDRPTENGAPQEPGAQPEGGNPAPAQSGAARTVSKPNAEPSVGAHQPIPKPDSAFVDKAGNFVLSNINEPGDVKQAIRDSVNRNDEFIDARRGVVSDAMALRLMDSSGLQAADLDRRQIGQAFNKEQIFSLEKLFIDAARNVADAARMAKEAGTDEAYLAYGEAEARHQMILDSVARHASAVRAEAGRALQAYSALKRMGGYASAENVANIVKDSTGKTLFQLRQRADAIAGLDTPAKVAGAINEMSKPSYGAMALEIFKNWLISGPITHSTYAIGNFSLALWRAVPETAAEATAGVIREAITGKAEPGRVRYGEIGAQLHAMFYGQRTGWRAAWDSFKQGQTSALPHEAIDRMTKAQRARFDTLTGEGKSAEDAISQVIGPEAASTPFTNSKAVPNFTVAGQSIPLGSIVRSPGERMVAPLHSYFRTIGYLQNLSREAYRTASDEGLTGTAHDMRVAELTRRPSEEMMEKARHEATEQTLMGRGGDLTRRVSYLMSWEPNVPLLGPTRVFGFIDPFVHVSSNILEQGILTRGPLGILTQKTRADVYGANGAAAQDSAIGRLALGSSLTAVGIGLAMEGLITPSAPKDRAEANMDQRVNGMPHSLNIGGMSIELSRLGVLGFQLSIAADLQRFADAIGEKSVGELTSLLIHSFTQSFLDESFMQGPSDLMKVLDDSDRYGKSYINNFVSSFAVPFSVGMSQVARQVDPYAREARSLLDTMIGKIPFASESLYPRIDIWGNPVPNREFWGVYTTHLSQDPVDLALQKLAVYPSPVERKIRNVELTDQQYHDYAVMAGRYAKMQLDLAFSQPQFANAPDFVQRDVVEKAIKNAREAAATTIMANNPGIIGAANDAKTAPLRGEPVHKGPIKQTVQ